MESTDEHSMESDTDLISVLPGKVLQHILSFLRIRAIVRMRRLSRGGREDFEHWKFEKVARFVDNLLLICSKVDLHTFQLHWVRYLPLNCNDVRKWIGYAVKHNVKLSLNQFIGQSPNLEHLINSATYLDMIASKVLKRLTLDGFMYGLERFTIFAPHLVHFECQDCALQDVSCGEQPSLESAHIDTWGKKYDGEPEFIGVFLSAKMLALFGSDVKLPQAAEKGAETDAMPIDGMTFQCLLLETVIIQCSKGDDGIDKLVNVLAANGINPKKIQVTFYEDIEEMELAKNRRIIEEQEKELCNFDKMAKENPKWDDESHYADSNPGTDSDEYDDDDYDDF
uniref:F-box domain-containing protein n=1 Tax=Oryza punctata TaxID=4537 RepID=A0A0E0JPQ0_ORYPU